MNATFRDHVVIVTGASRGIGREIACQLADQSANLVLAARSAEALATVAEACRERGGRALAVPADVTDPEQCRTLVERGHEAYGRIDMLINNAGISMVARFDELRDLSLPERIMRVNYLGSVYCTYYALSHLKTTRGRIVGVSSLTGRTGVPLRSAYAASKHAMAGFFDSLRIELIGSGVSVTMTYPDFVATEVRDRALGPNGEPVGIHPADQDKFMSAEECARIIIGAAAKRKREVIMSARGKVGQWIKVVAPGVVDRIAKRAMERVTYSRE